MAKTQKRLTSFEKGRIMQMRNNGNTTFFIMQELGKSRSTINDFILRMSKGGNIERIESSGRKRKTTPRDDKLIVRQVLKSRRVSCPSIREDLGFQNVSVSTIQRRIKETGRFVSTWTKRKPYVSAANRKRRVEWCKARLHWTRDQWRRIVWSDESPYVFRCNRRARCYRLKGEKYNAECLQGTVKHDKKNHGVGMLRGTWSGRSAPNSWHYGEGRRTTIRS